MPARTFTSVDTLTNTPEATGLLLGHLGFPELTHQASWTEGAYYMTELTLPGRRVLRVNVRHTDSGAVDLVMFTGPGRLIEWQLHIDGGAPVAVLEATLRAAIG